MRFRQAARCATDSATELGEECEAAVSPSGSRVGVECQWSIAEINIGVPEEPGVACRETYWLLIAHRQNETVPVTCFETDETEFNYPAQQTASATTLPEFRRTIEPRVLDEWHRDDPAFKPSRTALGTRLRELRRHYLVGGGRLLSPREIDQEIADRRGEREREEH